MLEYEKKVLLQKDEYRTLVLLKCKELPVETQTNYYFDNDDMSMNKKGITCRIRSKNGKYKATVKSHEVDYPDCSIEVDLAERSEFCPQIFNVLGLHYQGALVTERITIYEDFFCKMVLDRNTYLGHTDFELEIEYCKACERAANTLIQDIAEALVASERLTGVDKLLERVGQGGSKSQRFFERLKSCK